MKHVLFLFFMIFAIGNISAQCVPEICNNIDDNCNGLIDEGALVCPAPVWPTPFVSNITSSSSTLHWLPATCGYTRVQYRKFYNPTVSWMYVNSASGASSQPLTGLVPSTIYAARVRTVCNPAYLSVLTTEKRWTTLSAMTSQGQEQEIENVAVEKYYDFNTGAEVSKDELQTMKYYIKKAGSGPATIFVML